MTKLKHSDRIKCRECGIGEGKNKVFEFGDSDGEECFICDDCYWEHEDKRDWVS